MRDLSYLFGIMHRGLLLKNGRLRVSALFFKRVIGRKIIKDYYRNTTSIFIHVPKAAGKSVATSLYCDDKPGHYYASDYKREDPVFFETAFKFGFVRDPYDRLESAYNFLTSGGGNKEDREIGNILLSETTSFTDFVINWLTPDRLYFWQHFVPQVDFLCISGKLAVDYVARFETLENDFDVIVERLALMNVQLASLNKGKLVEKEGRGVLDECKLKVRELYKADYETFGY